jgi:hypothetical protein
MKTNKTLILTSLIALFCAAAFFSCENPIGLGPQLDIKGPVVEFASPAPRTTVPEFFEIAGTVSDSSPIETLLLKASLNNVELAKQWRYTRNKKGFEVSEDRGANWKTCPSVTFVDGAVRSARLNGNDKSFSWTIPIDMGNAADGDYTFTVQAWDSGGFTDDNSFKTLVLIYDKYPPSVEVFNPHLYSRHSSYDEGTDKFGVANDKDGKELQSLRDAPTWKNPSLLGKFLTQEFQLQWQIEDNHDIASIEILFVKHTVVVDNIPETPIEDDVDVGDIIYLYKGSNNPNGSVWVPNLSGNVGTYNETKYDGGEIKNKVDSKTTIKVVALCSDMAGHMNIVEERVLGYFIFWPEAAEPWIEFIDGMKDLDFYDGKNYTNSEPDKTRFEGESFMIYPGRSIKATAFQAQGASKVKYSLHKYDFITNTVDTEAISLEYLLIGDGFKDELSADGKGVIANNSVQYGSFTPIFPWSFTPPPRSGVYVIRATPYDFNGDAGDVYESVFRVQDITFPDFPEPPSPSASEPLFKAIQNNKITISGIVSDATEVVSLYIVWINPQSESYAAMSQLSYFRDSGYVGWKQAVDANLQDGAFIEENKWDDGFPNKVWKVPVTLIGEDPQTFRRIYSYSQTIDITQHLNIAGTTTSNNQPLISQIFLLRAENPNDKCTIITYAPQGDTLHPRIGISKVTVTSSGGTTTICNPGEYQQVPIFSTGDRIFVEGWWEEDSTEILPIQTYLTPNIEFEINRNNVTGRGTLNPSAGNATSGTFTVDVIVGTDIDLASMKDTLSVSATIKDIGGNPAEVANSWLIEVDTLRFLRISSEKDDGAYRDEAEIDIFIEFNKAVTLKSGRSNPPILILNTTGGETAKAVYKGGQNNESTRQYFTYTVKPGQNVSRLNVSGISIDNGNTTITNDSASAWQAAGYPFTWENLKMDGEKDEIRLTRVNGHNGNIPTGSSFYARALPVTTTSTDADYMFTLGGGKRIQIDNTPPQITSFTTSQSGWFKAGTSSTDTVDIYITANFNKPVQIGTGTSLPRLSFNTSNWTSNSDAAVTVNNDKITFRYTVQSTDNVNPLIITNFSGVIKDIPGTPMLSTFVSSMSTTSRTLTNVNLDNTAPDVPTVTVHSASPTTLNRINPVPLTLYHNTVYIQILGALGATNMGRIEYSLNDGVDWTSSTNATTNLQLVNEGGYKIVTRQIDQAGNSSGNSTPAVTFTRDSDPLITRISSSSPNGIYTHNSNPKIIPIMIYFRKPVNISAVSGITLNALRSDNPITLTTPTVTIPTTTPVSSLTFNYEVTNGDRTPTTPTIENLNVTGIGTITATDASGVNVSSFFALPAAGQSLRLGENKQIRVQTGNLSYSIPTFINENTAPWTTSDQNSQYYQGIRSDDGSYWTTLQIVFNNTISKGSGTITIEQIAGTGAESYRLPAVLTESQYNRFKAVTALNSSIDTYYTKGTNGYINGQGSDTSTKYVLNYNNNPNSGRGGTAAFDGDTLPVNTFFTNFREAEGITLSMSSQAVEVSGTTLKVRLTGSNAPQVPGARYLVTVTADSIIDNLGNRNNTINANVDLGGVAKPIIRIKKTQDIIGARQTSGANTPTLTATQPLYAYVRMDSRTPNSSIVYWTAPYSYTANASNWNGSDNANPGPVNPNTPAANRPSTTGTSTTYVAQPAPAATNQYGIRIGADTYGGYKWYVVARATANVGGTPYTSADSDEMAYRTAITYRLNAMAAPSGTTGQQRIGDGMQIWIRGGDSVGSSSIPGFPFTWEDNWSSLNTNKKRAGIRLMTKTNNTDTLINSTWQFMTWDMNATAYVDFVLGLDNTQIVENLQCYSSDSIEEVWQYGPRYWAMQRAGWTPLKSLYPVYPGEIRYFDTGTNLSGNGVINYSAAFNTRGAQAVNFTDPNTN